MATKKADDRMKTLLDKINSLERKLFETKLERDLFEDQANFWLKQSEDYQKSEKRYDKLMAEYCEIIQNKIAEVNNLKTQLAELEQQITRQDENETDETNGNVITQDIQESSNIDAEIIDLLLSVNLFPCDHNKKSSS